MATSASSTEFPPATPGWRATWWSVLQSYERAAALLLAAFVFSAIQSGTLNIVGIDGYYHIKVAALIREYGPRLDFPWLQFTILNREGYSDHHLLFHILQAPFTLLDLRVAAKVSAALFAALGAWAFYLVLSRLGVRWPLVWMMLLLAASQSYLWRHSMSRPQGLSVLLMMVVVWLLFERRLIWLVPAGFASAWLFNGFVLPLAIPAAWLVARLLLDRRLDWQPLACLLLGTVLGLVLNPYFPNNVLFAFEHLLPKVGVGEETDVRVGNEWYPYSPRGFAYRVGPSLLVMLAGMLPLAVRLWRQERPDPRTLTLTLLALLFFGMVSRSQRIIEYYPVWAVLLAAWAWSHERPGPPAWLAARLEQRPAWVDRLLPRLGILAVALLAVWLGLTTSAARNDADGAGPNARVDSFRDAALWLAANTPHRSLVYNVDWDSFPQMFFWNHHNVYAFGLDPTYVSRHNPETYTLMRRMARGDVPEPSSLLRTRFQAAYVMSDVQGKGRFLQQAAADPGLQEVFRSEHAVVFRVLPAPS